MKALVCLLSIFSLIACSPLQSAQNDGSRLRVVSGIYYDDISQGYFLSTADTLSIDEDSLTVLKRTSDEISSVRLKTSVDWTSTALDSAQLQLGGSSLLSAGDIRSNADLSLRRGAVEVGGGIEGRGIWDTESSGSGYLTWRFSTRLRPRIGAGFFFLARDAYESVHFSGSDDFNYDYRYNKLYLGIEKEFGWTDLISVQYRSDQKVAPDSTRLNYMTHRAIVELDWSPSQRLSARLESDLSRRLSDKENGIDDGWEELFEADIDYSIDERWRVGLNHEFEYASYDTQDIVNSDHICTTTDADMSFSPSQAIEVGGGVSVQQYRAELIEFAGQDHEQYSLRYSIDISPGEWLWLDASHTIGHRNYIESTGDLYTDYLLNRLDVFGDVKLCHGLSLNCMISVDWESHEKQENSNTLSLISIGIDYTF